MPIPARARPIPRRDLNTNVRVRNPGGVAFDRYKVRYAEIFNGWRDDWKETLRMKTVGQDFMAGVTVAAVALPLNLALSIASGLPPIAGLVAGAVGGATAAIFGGATLQVTGPAAALSAMVFALVATHGPAAAAFACLIIAFIAMIGTLTLSGKYARLVPESLLAGFTTGVGLKLLDNQVPELLGFDYKVSELAGMIHRPAWLGEVSWLAVVCGMFVALLVISTKNFKRFPAALVGVSLVTALSVYLDWDLKRVGEVPSSLPSLGFPSIPLDQIGSVVMAAIPLGLLALVESLLSAKAVDRLAGAKKPHDPDLEIFGQGMANLVSGLFGGMPVSGVIVRSSVNLQSGGKSRLSSLFHALILMFSVLYLSDSLALIPLAGLAGLLLVVGWRLIEVTEFFHALKRNPIEALAFLSAAIGTLTGHLMLGLVLGGILHFGIHFFSRSKRHAEKKREDLQRQGIRALIGTKEEDAALRKSSLWDAKSFSKSDERFHWLPHVRDTPLIPASSYVHPDATVIGRVVLGHQVHVAADTSIRADEGTPFYIGDHSNVQDGVVLHALKDKKVTVRGEDWAIYVGKNVSMAHQALIHGPSFIGDDTFIGFKAVVHDSIVGARCFVGIGTVVVGVEIPDGRFVPHGMIVDTQDKVDALPLVSDSQRHFNEDVVEVNIGLAGAYHEHARNGAGKLTHRITDSRDRESRDSGDSSATVVPFDSDNPSHSPRTNDPGAGSHAARAFQRNKTRRSF